MTEDDFRKRFEFIFLLKNQSVRDINFKFLCESWLEEGGLSQFLVEFTDLLKIDVEHRKQRKVERLKRAEQENEIYFLRCEESKNKRDRIMQIFKASCWKCHSSYLVAIISDEMQGTISAKDFNESELKIAIENGVIIKQIFSKTVEYSYNASACGHCSAFCGDFFACCEIWHEFWPPVKEISL